MKISIKKCSGITLTELMIATVVTSILLAVVGNILLGQIRFSRLTNARADIQRDARESIDTINRYLRQAKASSVTISTPASQPPCSQITFTHINGQSYSFYQSGADLIMSVNGINKKISQNLRTLFFAFPHTDEPTIISVSVCFEKATYEGRSKTLQLSVEKVRIMNN
jgi:Tfp pilus assembly protein PilE